MTTYWHAVTFMRPRSRGDEGLARELLLEWAGARGLEWAAWTEAEKRVAKILAIPPLVRTEEWDYQRRAGYAMEFAGVPIAPTGETRLTQDPTAANWVMRDREERRPDLYPE